MTNAPAIAEFYERYWREGSWSDNAYERWKLERVSAQVSQRPGGARVLDVGCGDGWLLAALAPIGIRGFGIDVSNEAVAASRARGVESACGDVDGGSLPVESASFDVVLCLDVLEHLFAPDRLLSELARVLAPGGRLVVAVPNGLNLFNRLAFLAGHHVDIMDKAHLTRKPFSEHLRFFSREVFEQELRRVGFVPTAREYFFPERFSDTRFALGAALARGVTWPRLHERLPSWFALEFLFTCERDPNTTASPGDSR